MIKDSKRLNSNSSISATEGGHIVSLVCDAQSAVSATDIDAI